MIISLFNWKHLDTWLRVFVWSDSIRNWLRYKYFDVIFRQYMTILRTFHFHWLSRTHSMFLKWEQVTEGNILQHYHSLFHSNWCTIHWNTEFFSFFNERRKFRVFNIVRDLNYFQYIWYLVNILSRSWFQISSISFLKFISNLGSHEWFRLKIRIC